MLPFAFIFEIWNVHFRRRRYVTTASAAVSSAALLLWRWCSVPVVVSMVVVLLLSRLCEDEALSRLKRSMLSSVCL